MKMFYEDHGLNLKLLPFHVWKTRRRERDHLEIFGIRHLV